MNKLVIYQSETGFTRQYAQWIAEALGCPARPAGEVTEAELAGTCLLYTSFTGAPSVSVPPPRAAPKAPRRRRQNEFSPPQ